MLGDFTVKIANFSGKSSNSCTVINEFSYKTWYAVFYHISLIFSN